MGDASPKRVISINDMEFEVGPCPTCGGSASEVEALRALAEWDEWFGERPHCAACGAAIRMARVIVSHRTARHGQGHSSTTWKVMFVVFPDCLNLAGFGGTAVRLHGACARRALPHADSASLEGRSHVEEGRKRMPWDDIAGYHEGAHGA